MRTIDITGTLDAGTTCTWWAKRSHNQRPRTIPSGTPTTVPIVTAAVDCQATAAASWRRVKPSVLSRARSRRRRQILHTGGVIHCEDPQPAARTQVIGAYARFLRAAVVKIAAPATPISNAIAPHARQRARSSARTRVNAASTFRLSTPRPALEHLACTDRSGVATPPPGEVASLRTDAQVQISKRARVDSRTSHLPQHPRGADGDATERAVKNTHLTRSDMDRSECRVAASGATAQERGELIGDACIR